MKTQCDTFNINENILTLNYNPDFIYSVEF